ncbi:inactive pancreatic lipase-related protein 1-like [Saccostrea cucullata]|uniref:inactive pancreatic lipase-related protein 1-like n=1 Tax=Saccostrea cuccullata TaxID=36930 RepID=UPI002ED59E52
MKSIIFCCLFFVASSFASVEKRNTVCYQTFGCFSSDGLLKAPQSPSEINTYYRLYVRGHSSHINEIGGPTWQSEVTPFTQHVSPTRKTKVLVHGFLDNGRSQWVMHAKNELLKKGDFNVIVVDWGTGAKWPYEQAAGNGYLVAAELASLFTYLHDHAHISYSDVHIIGHSLGAQIAGLTGQRINKIGRITGLDPADPLYSGKPKDRHLDPNDATFVDVIHTDSSNFAYTQGFGTHDIEGDVDFFPNGGEHQPGCPEDPGHNALYTLLHGGLGTLTHSISCSHSRATDYFIESINSHCKFFAHKCSNITDFDEGRCMGCPDGGCAVMGYDADVTSLRGAFYLSTSTQGPYCGYEYYVQIVISHSMHGHSYGELYVRLQGTKGESEELKFSRKMQYYITDSAERHVLVTHTDVGDITGVKVKFVRGDGVKATGSQHEVIVRYVTVEMTENAASKVKFCGHDAHIHENHVATLHSTSGW